MSEINPLVCSVEGCEKLIKTFGMCGNHYQMYWKYGRTTKKHRGDKRKHPFYSLWFERKQTKQLCEAWIDFWKFVEGISPKPEGNYIFLRKTNGLFGPDNFEWREYLKRKEGENNKDWWARKWAARQAANPGMERARSLKRYYGMTTEQYEEKCKLQNGVCAICEEKENSVHGPSGTLKRLAVDHCHTKDKIRDLLCWRCNGTLGKVQDNVQLLQKMIDYLMKHNTT